MHWLVKGSIHMSILFETNILKIKSHNVIKLPQNLSKNLSSRGMLMIQGTINNVPFEAPLEPDGKGSHWFEVSDLLSHEVEAGSGQPVSVSMEPLNEWREPEIPEDIMAELKNACLMSQWNAITTNARWDWLRWIRSTNNQATRQKRIQVACSKLQNGDKRPCCFDRSRCTVPDVSKSGVLLDELNS